MKLEQLQSLTEDEQVMLWYFVNKITPPVLENVELDISVFTGIKHQELLNRITQGESLVKEEFKPIYDSLKAKMEVV